jgi:hypothetical protein
LAGAFLPAFQSSHADLGEKIWSDRPLEGGGDKRHGARLVIKHKRTLASRILRHFREDRSRAEHKALAGNLHARLEMARPLVPFLQNLLPRLRQNPSLDNQKRIENGM